MSSIPDFNDKALWARLLKGDDGALDKIYRTHFDSLYQYGMRMLKDEDQVRDCLHDLFLKLWTNRKSINEARNTTAYLISSFRNLIINHRNKYQGLEMVEATDENHHDLDFSLESEYIHREDVSQKARRLAVAMDKLTSRQKEIIYLKYFEDLSYAEISDIMDLTPKGTYKLSARAMEALRDLLKIDNAMLILLLIELKQNHFFLK
ncbi:RNA polymerase sigma factor [Pedobacter agri]|uniref:RNA polymerase sigma factor n=1 Tax=Pedobacter agri TaxID=454586 RepID=UPI0029302D53|nr:sigma-70 family RNA polymerase sigma factor [Pedobacter agri]